MPSKRVILLDRLPAADTAYRAVLWADVPAGNQIAHADPTAASQYENITPAELQAIRDGAVAEKVVGHTFDSGANIATVRSVFDGLWAGWQAAVGAEVTWGQYGSYSDSGGAWQPSPGVPMYSTRESVEGLPSFRAVTPLSAFGANKYHLVLFNNAPAATSQGLVVKVRQITVLPGTVAVTGAAPSPWQVRRRTGPTTAPSGTGGVTPFLYDTAQPLPAGIGVWSAPQNAPNGGVQELFLEFTPQADELKLSTADAPTLGAALSEFGGQVVYNSNKLSPCRPVIVRTGQTLEVQQSATSGTGNCRVAVDFTVGG